MKRKYVKWTITKVRRVLKDCNSRREVERKYPYLYYNLAKFGDRKKLLSHLPFREPIRQVGRYLRPYKKASKKELMKIAQLYSTRNVFKFNARQVYNECIYRGILNDVCVHMKTPLRKHTKMELKRILRKYETTVILRQQDPYAYQKAKRWNII